MSHFFSFSKKKIQSAEPDLQAPEIISLDTKDLALAIQIKHNARAKRYTLRLPRQGDMPVLTIPKHGTKSEALDFAHRHAGWIAKRLAARPAHTPLEPGVFMPFRGIEHQLIANLKQKQTVEVQNATPHPFILVRGMGPDFEKRLTVWLKDQARFYLHEACHLHARTLGLTFKSITIRDQKTRWGSCSSDGRLNFSWRLILAPPAVLNYVAAHEVAHLQEMNHQPGFWALVEQTCPDMHHQRLWLRNNGGALHRIS